MDWITKLCADGRFGLLVQTLRCLGLYAFVPVLPRLCLTGFTFAQPFLASSLISYLENPEEATENQGYGLIGASFLVYTGVAVCGSLLQTDFCLLC